MTIQKKYIIIGSITGTIFITLLLWLFLKNNKSTPKPTPQPGILCSNHGHKEGEKCTCDKYYSGSNCELECSGNGSVQNDQCNCKTGFDGDSCQIECSGHGNYIDGKCICPNGSGGPDCSCNNCVSDDGKKDSLCYRQKECGGKVDMQDCVNEKCPCDPSAKCEKDYPTSKSRCFCGSDKCVDGKCKCIKGWSGWYCQKPDVPETGKCDVHFYGYHVGKTVNVTPCTTGIQTSPKLKNLYGVNDGDIVCPGRGSIKGSNVGWDCQFTKT